MTADGEWFTVVRGPDAGAVRLAGWFLTAVAAGPGMSSPWYALASCPRCGALVSNDDAGDERPMSGFEALAATMAGCVAVRVHENWHAATDHPRPSAAELE